jgi:uncharacterized membrane protein YeaQ/YmgE (transglycosylase-associated protein family)
MSWLAAMVGNGAAIDWILGLVGAEAASLIAYRWYTRNGLTVAQILSLLLPGAGLLLALRCALTNAGPVAIAAFLLAAFVTHLADLALRWRVSARNQGPVASSNSSAKGT